MFIYGGLGNLWNLYPQLDRFCGHRELVAYSLAGNGRSDDRGRHSLPGHVQDLTDLLTVRDVRRPILIGWSYGTAVALEYAKTYPVAGLVLTADGAYGLTPAWESPLLKVVTALRLYRMLPGTAALKALVKWSMLHCGTQDSTVDNLLQTNPLPRRASAWRSVTDVFWGYDGRDGLEKITCPALVVHGTADRVAPHDVARSTAQMLPNARFQELAHSGHLTLAEQPETFGRLLDSLITRAEEH